MFNIDAKIISNDISIVRILKNTSFKVIVLYNNNTHDIGFAWSLDGIKYIPSNDINIKFRIPIYEMIDDEYDSELIALDENCDIESFKVSIPSYLFYCNEFIPWFKENEIKFHNLVIKSLVEKMI